MPPKETNADNTVVEQSKNNEEVENNVEDGEVVDIEMKVDADEDDGEEGEEGEEGIDKNLTEIKDEEQTGEVVADKDKIPEDDPIPD